ncbi:MAG: molybdate ABC transporter substrate-binding protein [Polynucleobacter sp.]|nr:MAG: molybdate ABC transporter substrate-binding protein [Polynucleobacter sp.]
MGDHLKRLITALIATSALTGQVWAADLTVSAASSLTNAFKELAQDFEKQNGVKVLLNFAASGQLAQQIITGAPVDVFASADQETMDRLSEKQLIHSKDRINFASNELVVVVPVAAKSGLTKLEQLNSPTYQRAAIGLPASVPVGKYAQMVLQKQGLWLAIEAKMIGAQNVRQVLDYVARGEVDAGFVYATDAAIMRDKVKVAMHVPTDKKILYPMAPIVTSAQYSVAQKFTAFVQSEKGRAILKKYGFGSVSQ